MTNPGKYSSEIKNMQEQSLNKMREMYSKSKNNLQNNSFENIYQGKRFSEKEKIPEKKPVPHEKKKSPPPPQIMTNFLDAVLKDPDKTLIIMLIILLMDNEENFTLIMVLFYLLA